MSLVFALCASLLTDVLRCEPEALLACAGETIDLCESLGLVTEVEWARCYQAWAIGERGDLDAAIAQLRHSLDRQVALKSMTARSIFLGILAEHLLHARRLEKGHAAIAEAFAFRDRTGERIYEAELLRVEGRLFDAEGRSADAERRLRAAVAVAQQQSALTFELRATTALSRLLHAQRRSAEAARALAAVYGRFTEGFATAHLREAAAQIQSLAAAGESSAV